MAKAKKGKKPATAKKKGVAKAAAGKKVQRTPQGTVDQRELNRIPFAQPVEVTFDEYKKFTVEYAENISQGGMFLRSNEPVSVGGELNFRIKIRDINQEIAGRAKVVWTKEIPGNSGMGLQFIQLEGDSEAFIKQFINRHAVTEIS